MDGEWAAGKVALVTGGTSGIGRAAALRLARAGAAVTVVGLHDEEGAETLSALEAAGARARFVRADVSDEDQVAHMVAATVEAFGRLDVACNSAGYSSITNPRTGVTEMAKDEWDRTIGVNLTGVWLSMKHEIPAMVAAGGGSIVNIGSTAGTHGSPRAGAYSASKAGVFALTRTAAKEFASQGVRINAIVMGQMETPMLEEVFEHQPERRTIYADMTPLGRIGDPQEAAAVIAFLCSPDASYMTGALVAVDGGMSA
jgi:NAD(P)-dependent dehydrogenase (short-subunit alcohol dehydrogenase family)